METSRYNRVFFDKLNLRNFNDIGSLILGANALVLVAIDSPLTMYALQASDALADLSDSTATKSLLL